MNPLITLPTAAEQTRHALVLLGAPAPARLLVEVHAALFDGDLDVPALAGLVRDRAPGLAPALTADLTPVWGVLTLAEWPIERRLLTPARQRADALAMVLRVAEFVAAQPHAGRAPDRLLRELAHRVPHGPEAEDLADAAREALTDARLAAALAAEEPARESALQRADGLDETQRLYGLAGVPHQRGHG
jgi:hypothetical protein